MDQPSGHWLDGHPLGERRIGRQDIHLAVRLGHEKHVLARFNNFHDVPKPPFAHTCLRILTECLPTLLRMP
ncbi:MAG: hypothetical protein SNJ84_07620 [Verrucomicrobiia bacterium]